MKSGSSGPPPHWKRSPLRIGLDCSSAATASGTGIAHYIHNLLAQYGTAAGNDDFVACWRLSRHRHRRQVTADLPRHVRRAVWQAPFRPVGGGTIDLFHGLDVRVPGWKNIPIVATIHDIFSVVSDEFAKPKFRKRRIRHYQNTLKRADVVICDSQSTADDLRTHLDAPADKLTVIPLGVDTIFRPEAAADIDRVREYYPVPEHYVLYVGRMDRRKNVTRLIQAFGRAAPALRADMHLLLVGAGGYGSDETMAAVEASTVRDRIVHIGELDSANLPPIYAAASGLAFPTLYEGFGLPIAEAMASGCPALIGNAGSSPEVGGDAALAVDPTSVDAIEAGLIQLMTDDAWRVQAIPAGLERARELTWQRTANSTRRVYHRLLAGAATAEPAPTAV